ncbi:glycosyl transferase family 1 [Peptococcaceae bacterium SCADC1_2_3]|nr:glycosyl transferase family 1 [Peptococcaceae bacterium SCADC1_2_3]KFI36449.1 glycosyl transferase family 1 [Peptococcaceae bacterium SCADC1_2_3]KFI37702.1 glycosyl transferase family 1 [Peptococcaceae bacterium SCADC1_2_3]
MRIAILVSGFPPKWLAGTEIATHNIARHLAMRGHEVHVITSLDKGLPKESFEQGFYVHRVGWQKVRFVGVISFWLKIVLVLNKIKPSIVHSQSISMGMPGFLIKKLFKKPYLVWGQGTDVYFPGLFMRPLSKLVLRNTDAAIALTEDMKEKMQKICNREFVVISNGINLERFDDLLGDALRYKLQASSDERLVIFVGRFRPEKGVRYLIEAMKIIRQKSRSIRLILGGEGPEEEDLKRLIEQLNLGDCVDFLGQIPNEDVSRYMVAAHVFVLPSLSEGFGIVNLEAMASGLPIVASKVGGLPEIIEDGENGFLVEPRSPKQIADKVLLLLADDELRERISKNNKEKAKNYSWTSIIEKLEKVYQNCL